MLFLHFLEFLILSFCINAFIIFISIFYYSDLLINKIVVLDLEPEYDFIIVGSGTAGSIIAHRLATETNYTFVVLEAGGHDNFLFNIPVLGPLLYGSKYDWQYETVPQAHACYAMENKKCKLFQGKIVGGSSKLNNMIHVRGNISHYVHWFHREHTEEFITSQFELIEHKILHLDEIQYHSELADAVLDAAEVLGYYKINTEFDKSFRKSKVSQKNGKRWSTSDNLQYKHIKTNILVEKVLVEENKAYGVSILISDKRKVLCARKGVILSAGTLNTPKILQLSGIGPKEVLEPLYIPVIKDLPVGRNLQDHIGTGLDLIMFNKSLLISSVNTVNLYHAANYFLYGKGPFTTPGCEVVGFVSTDSEASPNLQFAVLPIGISSDRGVHLRKTLGLRDAIWDNYFAKTFEKHTATILPLILHPKSKGNVFINSRDPKIPPVINPKYFSNKEDINVLIKGLNLVKIFVETKAMKNIGAYINPLPFPGCEDHKIFSNAYWECYMKHLTLTSYHPVGTCSMGLPGSKTSVVDTSFRVIGIEGLFVADGSVLPTLPSGNINAAIAMMASIFFEKNILSNRNIKTLNKTSHKNDLLNEQLFKICIVESYL